MPGKVFVFNCSNEPLSLSVRGSSIERPIPAWSSWGAAPYQPQSIVVARARHGDGQSAPVFALGANPCVLAWESNLASVGIEIGGGKDRMDDDLILYVCFDQSMLVGSRGQVLGTFLNATRPR